ncbi:protein WVD2-like 7 isoform X2 [Nicotiana tabacum]|uniref:Protein WVD2-like 7 isoform X2 n=2 Tax=Nicotiana tabacum TaxID=4097 RepID=A0A1S3ZZN4_TOBAC|nr:PREDICTED: protein WVD2-like 7 isoform X2 [Nicotiana tabacum]XP_033513256.1 protein WVD2-like 7 isoform X2 [Nicotiana tomentosiformis]
MGESTSACLVRSFSQPSQERSEGDPLRALTASVSFGRFMNESLAWEKWSSFTHNRYQEEVEKYSRPGSVAEKKAYFEAQFKKAAAKKAAALLEQQNAAVGVSSDLNVTNQTSDHSTVNPELAGTSSYVGADEAQREEGDVTNQPIDDSPMESEVAEEALGGEGHLNVTNPNLDHRSTCSELPENSSYVGVEEAQGDDGDNTSTFGSYATHKKSNLELAETENSAEQSYPIENEVKSLNQAENVVVKVNENIVQLKKKTQTKKPLSTTSRLTNNNESSKLRSRVKPMTALPLKVTDNRKNGKDAIDKKRSNPKSLQTLIKFSSHKEETNKTLSPILEKIVNSRLVRSITKTSRDSKVQEISALASVSEISKRTSETPQRENRRNTTKIDQPFCRSRTEKGELLSHSGNFESINENGNRTCSRTVFSPFSLRSEERAAKRREFFQKLEQKLNTKEAEKQKLHAKPKEKATSSSKEFISRAKPTPSIHHERESFTNQTKKVKATSSSKVLTSRAKPNASIQHERESFTNQTTKEKATSSSKVHTSRAKPNASIHRERESSSNQMKKDKATSSSFKVLTSRAKPNASIHHERELSSYQMKMPRQPCSPKFSRKPVSEVQDNKRRQPWRLLGKPDGSKDVKRENNVPNHFPVKGRSHNPKSFVRGSTQENASPNIQV